MDDRQWVMDVLEHFASIGRTPAGGSRRLGFSGEDREARAYLTKLMEETGLAVRVDPFGNIIGRLEGRDPGNPAVACGSHIDTVPNGGHYDGVLGTVGALAALRRLAADGPFACSLECIVFQLEESSRFSIGTMGSKAMAGTVDLEKYRAAKDSAGITLPEAMADFGLSFEKLPQAVRRPGELKAFFEMHIDQSRTLQEAGVPLGVVTAIAAPIRAAITVEGEAVHSGSTPMNNRRDAVVSASELVLAVRAVGNRYSARQIVATVGSVKAFPGSMNVVPGRAELLLDLRGTDRAVMDEAYAAVRSAAEGIAAVYGTPIRFELLGAENPVHMDAQMREVLTEVCGQLGVPSIPVVSGAGHDAMNVAAFAPVGMLFVRSKDGISHNPAEYASPEDIMAGVDVLTEVLRRLAG